MKKSSLILVFYLCYICESAAQINIQIDSLASIYLESEFAKALSIGIIHNGEISYFNYGKISDENPDKPSENSIYEIGSISKAVTGTILQQLVEENKLQLDDVMCDFFPKEFCPWSEAKKISLLELSTHTSGIPRLPFSFFSSVKDMNRPYENHTKEEMFRFIKSYDPVPTKDREYAYSNYAFMILGYIMEQVEGKSYEQILLERILKPLKLYQTFVMGNQEIHSKIIQGHKSNGEKTPVWDMPTFPAPGGIRSTTTDMLRLLKHVMIDSTGINSTQKQKSIGDNKWIGLGWHIINYDFSEHDMILHNGQTGGYTSFAGFIEDHESAVVVLTNNSGLEDKESACDLLGLDILKVLSKNL